MNSRGVMFCYTGANVISATVNYDGVLGVGGSAYIYNLTVAGDTAATLGNFVISSGTPNPKLAGSETNFASGAVKYGAVTTRNDWITDPDLYCQDGVLHNLVLISSGNWLKRLTILDGMSAAAPTIDSGGIFYMSSGGVATDLKVISGGSVNISCGAVVSNLIVSDITLNNAVRIYSGAVVSGGTIEHRSAGSQAVIMYEDTLFDRAKVVRGSVYVMNSAVMTNVDLGGGNIIARGSGAVVSRIDIYGTGALSVQNGAYIRDVDLDGGQIIMREQTGSMAMGSCPVVEDVTMHAGSISIQSGATVRSIAAAGGTVTVSSGGLLSGATVAGDAAINVSNGGLLSGATINAGAFTVFSGGAVESLAIHGGDVRVSSRSEATDVTLYDGTLTFWDYTNVHNVLEISGGYANLGANAVINDGLTVAETASARIRTKVDVVESAWNLNVSALGTVNAGDGTTLGALNLSGGQVNLDSGATVSGATLTGGVLSAAAGAVFSGAINAVDGVTISGAQISGDATLDVSYNADAFGAVLAGASTNIAAGKLLFNGTATDVAIVNGVVDGINATAEGYKLAFGEGMTVNNATVNAGGKLSLLKGALVQGGNTDLAEGTLYFGNTAVAGHAENGVLTGLNAGTNQFQFSFGDGIVVKDAVGNHTSVRISAFDGACISGAVMYKGAIICNGEASGTIDDTVLAGGQINLSGTAKANRTVIENGGKLNVNAATASFDDTILKAGGQINFSNTALTSDVDTGKSLTIDYTGATVSSATIAWLDRIAGSTTVYMTGIDEAGNYEIKTSGGTLAKVTRSSGLYAEELTSGGASYTNGIAGLSYSFDGTKLTAVDAGIAAVQAAAKLADGATEINNGDKAAKWDATTTYSTNVFLADGMTTGNAWLAIDGFNAAANLYGAAKDQNFAGNVNIGANNGTVKNLAGGAGLGGKVAGVKLTVGDGMSVTGAVYAGGMGDVTGATETLIEGGSFAGNVFAGALCNYVGKAAATATGDIALTVKGGTFGGNLYAGAAVKAGAAADVVHTAGDITVELAGGTATKQTFCVYGGGYATGTVEDASVYAAGNVAITVNGGAWGEYLSGRGIFGGVYADKVAASVDKVDITVTGGTMGNVYGGGWAQNGGTSTVTGAVSITIAGDAEVNNVFGGGSCSGTSYGTTTVNSVSITVAGGDVANNIFAGGQNESNTVVGDVAVTFTGSNDYACNVYGYGVQSSATVGGDKTLTFAAYTGELSGDVGGFDGIVFSGDTAATLSGATIDNDDWSFDYTDRTLDADLVMATFGDGTFAGDTVSVNLADVDQVSSGWSIATGLTAANATFSVELSTGSADNLSLGDTLGSAYGVYEGWGFALEDSTLKFKNLA